MKLDLSENDSFADCLNRYNLKNFYKTASLIANSCKSVAILAGFSDHSFC